MPDNWLQEDEQEQVSIDPWETAPAPQASAPPPAASPQASAAPSYPGTTANRNPAEAQEAAPRGTGNQGNYADLLGNMNNASDPASKAVAQDELARRVQADLEADGHTVKWQGNTMIVDGRPYELGGQQVTRTPAPAYSPQIRDQVVQGWESSAFPATRQGIQQYLSSLGSRGAGWTITNDDKVRDPNGRIFDWIGNVNTAGAQKRSGYTTDSRYADVTGSGGGRSGNALSLGPGGSSGGGAGADIDWNGIYQMGLADSPEEDLLDNYMEDLLANPESMDAQVVDMLKARSAEDLAVAGQYQDDELQHFGFQAGLHDSPWLAGERSDIAWDRRVKTAASNRDIDIDAAKTNKADRRAAASIGVTWASGKGTKQQKALDMALNYLESQTGFAIDREQLAQQDEHFQQNLAYLIQRLAQEDEQFEANYGLAVDELDHTIDQDYWERGETTYNSPSGGS